MSLSSLLFLWLNFYPFHQQQGGYFHRWFSSQGESKCKGFLNRLVLVCGARNCRGGKCRCAMKTVYSASRLRHIALLTAAGTDGGTVGWGDLCDTTAPATASEFRRCSQSHSHPLRSSPQLESSEHLHLSQLRASGGSLCHSHHHHHRHQHWYCPQPAGDIRWEGLLSTGHLISLEAPLRGGVASGETFISSLPPASYRSLKTVV